MQILLKTERGRNVDGTWVAERILLFSCFLDVARAVNALNATPRLGG
jgi:hypothetical protein